MKRNKSQFNRLLVLDKAIREGEYPNCLSFSVDWEVSQKTIQRDIDFMRDSLGAPVEYDRDRHGFYYTDKSWFMPALSMSEGDLFALLVASRALEQYRGTPVAGKLESIFRKLMELLPEQVTIQPELVFSKFSFQAPPSKPIRDEVWTTVVRALTGQKMLKLTYRSFEAKESRERFLAPYHVANLQGEWYVFGSCEPEKQVRQFALPRIEKAALTDRTFEVPADFDAKKLLSKTFGRYVMGDKTHRVRLRFDKEIVPWVQERQWQAKQKTTLRRDGSLELEFEATGLFEVFRWVLAWGRHCRVLGPAELQKWVVEEVVAMRTSNIERSTS